MAYWSHPLTCKVPELLWSLVFHVKILFQWVLRINIWKQAHFNGGSNSIQKPVPFQGRTSKKPSLSSMAALQEQPKIAPYSDFKIVVCKRGISLPTHSVIVSLLVNAIVSHPFSSLAISVCRICFSPLQLVRVWERGKSGIYRHSGCQLSCSLLLLWYTA